MDAGDGFHLALCDLRAVIRVRVRLGKENGFKNKSMSQSKHIKRELELNLYQKYFLCLLKED